MLNSRKQRKQSKKKIVFLIDGRVSIQRIFIAYTIIALCDSKADDLSAISLSVCVFWFFGVKPNQSVAKKKK